MRQTRFLRVLVTLFILATMVFHPLSAPAGCGGCGTSSWGGGYYGYGGGSYYSSCGYSSYDCGCAISSWGTSYCGGCGSTCCYGGCYGYVGDCGAGCGDGGCGSCCGAGCGCCGDCGNCCGVVSQGSEAGCANCVSEPAVVYEESPVPSDSAMPMVPDLGSSSRGEMPAPPSEPPSLEAPSSAPMFDEQPAAPADDSMFDEQPAAPADAEDNMFDGGQDTGPDDGSDTGDDDFDDLFPASVQMRTWSDNTGNFSTRARFAELKTGSVRLLKESGRHCTVPLHRLSARDFQLVQQIAANQGLAIPLRLAQR